MSVQTNAIQNSFFQRNKSLFFLIISNFFPLIGVLLLGWSPMDLVYLYVIETIIIGILNVPKMALAKNNSFVFENLTLAKIVLIPFFIMHFGIGSIVQCFAVLGIGAEANIFQESAVNTASVDMFSIIRQSFLQVWWSAVLLLGSHVYSYYYNYLGKKEYLQADVFKLGFRPYIRVLLQMIIAIGGCILVDSFENGQILLTLFVILLKMAADASAHYLEHRTKN